MHTQVGIVRFVSPDQYLDYMPTNEHPRRSDGARMVGLLEEADAVACMHPSRTCHDASAFSSSQRPRFDFK